MNSTARVNGIDLSKKMLEILRSKNKDKKGTLNLIVGSYFEVELAPEVFDVAISVQSMHHFRYEQKLSLYGKIFRTLEGNGTYIEADYFVDTVTEEIELRNRYEALKSECKVPDGFYNFDLPLSIDNQHKVLEETGFRPVRHHARYGNTSIFVSRKPTSE
ncbi:MAG TPA: class I SAM-dependent methyltransferase [Mesotoga infera]|uniref:Class I SAM-dependent methyltransferase n=1 Tax=Mesotoga infera TaxID=1236046 RepID=A0A3D3TK45_9BACT|nr:class I SAM-dependent methyltransferase [Mesotoga infera]